jgi:hypothetical protein
LTNQKFHTIGGILSLVIPAGPEWNTLQESIVELDHKLEDLGM